MLILLILIINLMNQNKGIAAHLQKFYTTQLNRAEIPTLSLLASLKALNEIIKLKDNDTTSDLQSYQKITQYIKADEVQQLKLSMQRRKENQQVLKVIQICREIDIKILQFEDNIQATDFDEFHRLKERLITFKDLYQLIEKLDEVFNSMSNSEQNLKSEQGKQCEQIVQIRNAYFSKLKLRLYKAIVQLFYSHNRVAKVEESLQYFGLPIKKSNKQKDNMEIEKKILFNIENSDYLPNAYIIIEALFCEYCCYCLQKKIQIILGQQEQEIQEIENINQQNMQFFASPFFSRLWHKIAKSILYIFINSNQMNLQNNAYQIDQPNWLFEYMEQIFALNYSFISQFIIKLLKQHNETAQTVQSLQTFFVNYNYKAFFLKFIIFRLESDIQILKNTQNNQKNDNQNNKNKVGFIIFNFFDELHTLEQKMYETYNYEPNFIQNTLKWISKHSQIDILSLNFDYQHYWIEQRIFNDFYNINYSVITDLKNVEAYNITVNFIHIFEKLYSKFRRISNEQLKSKINEFYYEELLKLVRHTKTSFERIYNNSSINKYQTLISYKKVQDQFKAYFNQFIKQSPSFQNKIEQEYYSVLENYTNVLALQQLTSIHTKIYKRLSDYNDYFSGKTKQFNDLDHAKKKWTKIFEQWQQKVFKIRKIQPDYEDKKMRNIFFVFLESTQFSQDGFWYFISLFQPFLIILFSVEGTKILKMILEMEKNTLKQYCKSQQNNLWFLNNSELKSIQKCYIKPNK